MEINSTDHQLAEFSHKKNICFIGVSGNATAGKDKFFQLSSDFLYRYFGLSSGRVSFADQLKMELKQEIQNTYGIDVFNPTPIQKTQVRPLLVEYAEQRRKESNGQYWIRKLDEHIKTRIYDTGSCPDILFCTDLRFVEHEFDEYHYSRTYKDTFNVFIDRLDLDLALVPPANTHERDNNQKLRELADFHIIWDTRELLMPYIHNFFSIFLSMAVAKQTLNLRDEAVDFDKMFQCN